MAPEFFGFVVAGVLAVWGVALVTIVLLSDRRKVRRGAILALIPIVALVLLLILHLRQQFFLNEPLATAAYQGRIESVRELLDRGASPDSWGVDSAQTALMGASAEGHGRIVELLIERGADVHLSDASGRTALSYARERGRADIEKLLVRAADK